ncbi:hypothetical protein GOP47_0026552 [Adiantum capillus-veneris]|nr:hypothetical protein GOP47_0026552 [Adiantum capillus-veneris]
MDSEKLIIRAVKALDVKIREFNKDTDLPQVQELERSCDEAVSPPAGKTAIIFTNMNIGDPLCRVRSYPVYCMLVAEVRCRLDISQYKIVGVIRAGVKEVVRPVETIYDHNISGNTRNVSSRSSNYVTAMYISGLRICCLYRRMGVAQRLVMEIEAWGRKHGAQYAYLATENDNKASVSLFTHKLGYIKFRSPSILVQPVYGKPKMVHITSGFGTWQTLNNRIQTLKLSPNDAERLYRLILGNTELFPKDIDSVLKNPLNVGTWVACYTKDIRECEISDEEETMEDMEERGGERSAVLKRMEEGRIAWAMLSLWRYEKLIKFEVRGASALMRRWAALTRLASKLMPWMVLPCLPNVFDKAFGVQLMYGLHGCEPHHKGLYCKDPSFLSRDSYNMSKREFDDGNMNGAQALMQSLCWHAHNMALQAGCKAVVAEMGSCDPLKEHIPHWPLLSEHDLLCVKRLSTGAHTAEDELEDWCKWPPPVSLFLDPRDF